MEGDIFAAYAAMAENSEKDSLVTPEPIPHPHISLQLKDGKTEKCKPILRSYTKEALYKELDKKREEYSKYLLNFALLFYIKFVSMVKATHLNFHLY